VCVCICCVSVCVCFDYVCVFSVLCLRGVLSVRL